MATQSAEGVATRTLTLPEELVLMLLNEEHGYFHQVPGWALNCAIVGAALAELSLQSRIDTDMDSLFLVHRSGRMYLRAKDYFADFEKVYGANPVYCLPWMAPITSGFASPCRRRILAAGWKASWTSSTTMPGISWRTGKLERSMPRRPCQGE